MRITNIYVKNDCLVFCNDDGGKSIYHLSNVIIDTGLLIDSLDGSKLSDDGSKLSESRIQQIIEAEGEEIAIVEIKGLISRLENAENCLDVSYNELFNSCTYYFSGEVNQMLNQLWS